MAKVTRNEVLKMAIQLSHGVCSSCRSAAQMLRDLAPPDEPRQRRWQIGDLLRWDGRDYVVTWIGENIKIESVTPGLASWRKPSELADAIPLKLVEATP